MNETRYFLTTLLLIFITLKLCHVIEWSWAWVLLPFYFPIVVAVVIVFLISPMYIMREIRRRKWRC